MFRMISIFVFIYSIILYAVKENRLVARNCKNRPNDRYLCWIKIHAHVMPI